MYIWDIHTILKDGGLCDLLSVRSLSVNMSIEYYITDDARSYMAGVEGMVHLMDLWYRPDYLPLAGRR